MSLSYSTSCGLTAIITALLATVIFALVQIAIHRCRSKLPPRSAESAAASAASEVHVYEQVKEGERCAAVSDPIYMEVKAVEEGGGSTLKLLKNEAYSSICRSTDAIKSD